MSRAFIVEPEVEAEIARTAEWYDLRNPASRVGFFRAIDRSFELIQENPELYQVVYRDFRRALVEGYPYVLFYTADDSQIIVMSCFHSSRDPNSWRERIR